MSGGSYIGRKVTGAGSVVKTREACHRKEDLSWLPERGTVDDCIHNKNHLMFAGSSFLMQDMKFCQKLVFLEAGSACPFHFFQEERRSVFSLHYQRVSERYL